MSDQENAGFFQNFVNNIDDYINNLVTLDIKTVVGDFRVDHNDQINQKEGTDVKVINSKVHLLKGDVTTYISNDLVQDRYAWVRDFHAQKEQHGHTIINGNVKAIYSLFELYAKTKGIDVPPAKTIYGNSASSALSPQVTQPALDFNPNVSAFDPSQAAAEAPDFEAPAFDPTATAAEVEETPIGETPALEVPSIDFDAPAASENPEEDEEENNKKED